MRTAAIFLLCLGVCASASPGGLIIDDFEAGPFNEGTSPDTLTVSQISPNEILGQAGLPTSHVIGGQRYVDLTWTEGSPGQATSKVYLSAGNDDLRYNNETGIRSVLTLDYGRNADGTLSPLQANLLADGANAFELMALTDAPNHALGIRIDLVDADGATGTGSAVINSQTFTAVNIGFDAYAGVDLSNVSLIRVILTNANGLSALDANIDCISTVPEPTSMAILALGGLGLMYRRRRANKA